MGSRRRNLFILLFVVGMFLASSASAYVHGTIVAVDGGWLAR